MIDRLHEIASLENLNLDNDAAESIIKLSGGDMRKVLNVLESCSLAHKHITIQNVYEVTGRPSPYDMEHIYNSLTNDKLSDALGLVQHIKQERSLSVEDVITELHKMVMTTQMTDEMKIFLISRLA